MKRAIQPFVARFLSSAFFQNANRTFRAIPRKLTGQSPTLDVFIDASDPHSYLLVQALSQLVARYQCVLRFWAFHQTDPQLIPKRTLWLSHRYTDAKWLANLYGFNLPIENPFKHPSNIDAANDALASRIEAAATLADIVALFESLWESHDLPNWVDQASVSSHRQRSRQRMTKAKHFNSAVVYFEGESYSGVDRLDHLEQRLRLIFNAKQGNLIFNKTYKDCITRQARTTALDVDTTEPLRLYFSARSPYSYLALIRANALCQYYGLTLDIRLVLPMVMRDIPVPNVKKMAIFFDVCRESKKFGIPYGFVADPLGKPVEYCYDLYSYAKTQHKGFEFLKNFSEAVNAKGTRADKINNLQKIIEQTGLNWEHAKAYLDGEFWREEAEINANALNEYGLWGVPCMVYGETVVWGQDRLWAIEQAIQRKNGQIVDNP